jgi:tetratricopeptide (TPR) repeat protein
MLDFMTTSESLKTFTITLDAADLAKHYPNLVLKTTQDLTPLFQLLKEKYRGQATKLDIKEVEGYKITITWYQAKPSNEAEELNKEALSLIKKREFERALGCWRKALELYPNDPDFQYNVALVYLEMKNMNRGLDRCLETLRICPVYVRAYFVLGSIYSKMRQFKQSVHFLREGLLLQNSNILALVNLGAVFSIEKNYMEAIRIFERVIGLSPKEVRAYLGLGKVYVAQNDVDNASRCFKAVIKLDPNGNLGEIARKSLRAFTPLEHAPINSPIVSSADDENVEEFYAEGFQSFIKGDFESAISAYKKYLSMKPTESDVWSSLASCQLRMGRTKDAVDSIKRAIAISTNKPALYKQAAIIYDASALSSETAEAALKAMELGKEDSVTLTLLGKSKTLEGKHQEAVKYLQNAIKLNPSNINARFHYALSLKALGQKDTAKQQFEEILWVKTESPLKERAKKELLTI